MAEDLRKIVPFSVIGAGKLGSNLAYSLSENGFELKSLYNRTQYDYFNDFVENNIEKTVESADIIFIATGESQIGKIAMEISAKCNVSGKFFFHTSNALTSDELAPIKERGGHIAALSPIQTFTDFEKDPLIFRDVYFLFEGSYGSLETAKEVVSSLKGKLIRVKGSEKIFYHIAAVFSSNLLISLLRLSVSQIKKNKSGEGIDILLPLIRQTLKNVENKGLKNSLSGPVKRGETDIVRMHLERLKGSEKEVYRLLTQLLSVDNPDISPE